MAPIGKIGTVVAAIVAGVATACRKEGSYDSPHRDIDPRIRYGQLRQLVQGGHGCGGPLEEADCFFLTEGEPIPDLCLRYYESNHEYENDVCDPDRPNYSYTDSNGDDMLVVNDPAAFSDPNVALHEEAHFRLRKLLQGN